MNVSEVKKWVGDCDSADDLKEVAEAVRKRADELRRAAGYDDGYRPLGVDVEANPGEAKRKK